MAKDRARIPEPTVQFRILKDTIICGIWERSTSWISDEIMHIYLTNETKGVFDGKHHDDIATTWYDPMG